jgi:hypothetical protein
MNQLPPVGNGKRDQSCPAKGQLMAFAHLIGDFINTIGPTRTFRHIRSTSALGGEADSTCSA